MNSIGYRHVYSFHHSFSNRLSYTLAIINNKKGIAALSMKPEKLNPMNFKPIFSKQNVPYIYQNGILVKK